MKLCIWCVGINISDRVTPGAGRNNTTSLLAYPPPQLQEFGTHSGTKVSWWEQWDPAPEARGPGGVLLALAVGNRCTHLRSPCALQWLEAAAAPAEHGLGQSLLTAFAVPAEEFQHTAGAKQTNKIANLDARVGQEEQVDAQLPSTSASQPGLLLAGMRLRVGEPCLPPRGGRPGAPEGTGPDAHLDPELH